MTAGSVTESVSLREQQALAVRQRIVDATLSVIESGEEPQMRSVAKTAGISERTIYRYFASLSELHDAVTPTLRARASVPMAASALGLEDFAARLFSTFADNEGLVRALVAAGWGKSFFQKSRPRNLKAIQDLIDAAFPEVPRRDRISAATSLRVPLSGAGWVYLRDCGFSSKQCITHAQWLVKTVLQTLTAQQGEQHA